MRDKKDQPQLERLDIMAKPTRKNLLKEMIITRAKGLLEMGMTLTETTAVIAKTLRIKVPASALKAALESRNLWGKDYDLEVPFANSTTLEGFEELIGLSEASIDNLYGTDEPVSINDIDVGDLNLDLATSK